MFFLCVNEQSDSYYQRHDYRILPTVADASTKAFHMAQAKSLQEYPIQCVICCPAPDQVLKHSSRLAIRGYAIAQAGELHFFE